MEYNTSPPLNQLLFLDKASTIPLHNYYGLVPESATTGNIIYYWLNSCPYQAESAEHHLAGFMSILATVDIITSGTKLFVSPQQLVCVS